MPITTKKKKYYQDTGNAATARISLEAALSSHIVDLHDIGWFTIDRKKTIINTEIKCIGLALNAEKVQITREKKKLVFDWPV